MNPKQYPGHNGIVPCIQIALGNVGQFLGVDVIGQPVLFFQIAVGNVGAKVNLYFTRHARKIYLVYALHENADVRCSI